MKEQLAKMTIIELVRTAHSYSTSIKQTGVYSELVREMASRLEALNLAHIGSMYALEAAEKRIADLEARTVKLPKRSVGEVMHISGFSRDYAEGWCSGNDNARHEISSACIKLQIEGD